MITKEILGSVRSKRRYKPLVNLLIEKLLGSAAVDNQTGWKSPRIQIAWKPNYEDLPSWWPKRSVNTRLKIVDNKWIEEYNVDYVLQALYDQGLSDHNPRMIFAQRNVILGRFTCANNELDKLLELDYNETIDI